MKITDKILLEVSNNDTIYLYADGGIFVRAYNKSAYALEMLTGRKLQVNVKYNRKLKRQYVFVGFLAKSLGDFIFDNIKKQSAYFTVEPQDESHVVYVVRKENFSINEEAYQKWFSSHINKTIMKNGREENSDYHDEKEKESEKSETQEGRRCILPSSVHVNIYLHEGMHVQVQEG